MNEHITLAQMSLVGILTGIGAMFGKLGWMFLLWAVCAGLDYLTGSLAAWRNGKWCGAVAREGLWHKGGMIVVVLVAILFDFTLFQISSFVSIELPIAGMLATPLVLSWYITTELVSILENAVKMGAQKVPLWLVKGLALVADAVDKTGEKVVGKKGDDDEQHT